MWFKGGTCSIPLIFDSRPPLHNIKARNILYVHMHFCSSDYKCSLHEIYSSICLLQLTRSHLISYLVLCISLGTLQGWICWVLSIGREWEEDGWANNLFAKLMMSDFFPGCWKYATKTSIPGGMTLDDLNGFLDVRVAIYISKEIYSTSTFAWLSRSTSTAISVPGPCSRGWCRSWFLLRIEETCFGLRWRKCHLKCFPLRRERTTRRWGISTTSLTWVSAARTAVLRWHCEVRLLLFWATTGLFYEHLFFVYVFPRLRAHKDNVSIFLSSALFRKWPVWWKGVLSRIKFVEVLHRGKARSVSVCLELVLLSNRLKAGRSRHKFSGFVAGLLYESRVKLLGEQCLNNCQDVWRASAKIGASYCRTARGRQCDLKTDYLLAECLLRDRQYRKVRLVWESEIVFQLETHQLKYVFAILDVLERGKLRQIRPH